jgi:hypothetical protein
MKKNAILLVASFSIVNANAQVADIDSAKAIITRLVNSKFSSAVIETEVNRLGKDADPTSMAIIFDNNLFENTDTQIYNRDSIGRGFVMNSVEKTNIAFHEFKRYLLALNGKSLTISTTEIYDNRRGDKNPDRQFHITFIINDLIDFKYFGDKLVPCQFQISLLAAPLQGKWVYRTLVVASKQLPGALRYKAPITRKD